MIGDQHVSQYHSAAMSQVPQSNGLFCNSSSPMWGNQEPNGNMYHPLSQQQQQQICHPQQRLHNQHLHVRQQAQQRHPCHQQQEQQHRMLQQQLQQRQSHQQQLLNQHKHQQVSTQTMSLQQQQHHSFPFHQGGQPQSQQQVHHSQQHVQHHLNVGGTQFHPRALPNKSYLDNQNPPLGGTCLQAQQQHGSYQFARGSQAFSGSGPEDPNLPFPVRGSMLHSMPMCSVSSAPAYQSAQYPVYPGEPEMPTLNRHSLPVASVSRHNNAAPVTSTVHGLSGTGFQFPSTAAMSQQHMRPPVSQGEECPFRALHCSGETQGNCKSSQSFGESVSRYSNLASQLGSEHPQPCRAVVTNGCQALGDVILPLEAQDGDMVGLEPPDLLPDLLPQLEAALSQQDESNCSWADSRLARRDEQRKPPVECKEEKVIQNIMHCYSIGFSICWFL